MSKTTKDKRFYQSFFLSAFAGLLLIAIALVSSLGSASARHAQSADPTGMSAQLAGNSLLVTSTAIVPAAEGSDAGKGSNEKGQTVHVEAPLATATSCALPGTNYLYALATATVDPGYNDVGLNCDDCDQSYALPFPVTLYGSTFTSAYIGSNGQLAFGTDYVGPSISCWHNSLGTYVIAPYWTDQDLSLAHCPSCGAFVSTSGTYPNQIFNIEWRSHYKGDGSSTPNLTYEVRLHQNADTFDIVYGQITPRTISGSGLVVGVKKDEAFFTQIGCDPTGGTNPPVSTGQMYTYSTLLVTNGGFETGLFQPWQVRDTVSPPDVSYAQHHSGSYSAHLGTRGGNGDSSIYQEVNVPREGGILSYWWYGTTTEAISSGSWQGAFVTNTAGQAVATIMQTLQNTGGFVNVTYDLSAYAGQRVRIQFQAHNVGTGSTYMYVDDVSFTPACIIYVPDTATFTVTRTPTRTSTPTVTLTPTTPPCGYYRILIVYADWDTRAANALRTSLLAESRVARVDLFDAHVGTPGRVLLQSYQEVIVYSLAQDFNSNESLGNALAGYASGGGVVVGLDDVWDLGFPQATLKGSWSTEGYSPFVEREYTSQGSVTLGTCTLSPVCDGVTNMQSGSNYDIQTRQPGTTVIGTWSDGTIMAAYRTTRGTIAFGINEFPSSVGHLGKLIVNMVKWQKPAPACGTATAVVTSTYTPTITRTNTATRTITATSTRTNTATATRTSTRTNTAIPTATRTSTAVFTATRTNTSTNIPTSTSTTSATSTNSPTTIPPSTGTSTPANTATAASTSTSITTATSTNTNTPVSTATAASTNTAVSTSTATDTTTPALTGTATRTVLSTNTPTSTAMSTPSATGTPNPQLVTIRGHVTWEGLPAQPSYLQKMPLILTLRSTSTEVDFDTQLTDASGYFTVTATLPRGTYRWWVKGNTYLATAGVFAVTGAPSINLEMGVQKAGDLNGDNVVNRQDADIIVSNYGQRGAAPLRAANP